MPATADLRLRPRRALAHRRVAKRRDRQRPTPEVSGPCRRRDRLDKAARGSPFGSPCGPFPGAPPISTQASFRFGSPRLSTGWSKGATSAPFSSYTNLLPILMPEYFREAEFERHRNRLRNFARFGTAAIVTTKTVAADLTAHMGALGRHDVPIFQAPTPIAAIFATPRGIDARLDGIPFFVCSASTIEPRKNHLMILWVWRALVARASARRRRNWCSWAPEGWHYDMIIDLIARSPALRDSVLEVGGLSTPGLKRLMDNARAVLMPTFGEGYGLPVHEALAAGAPVIASDVPVFREITSDRLTLISPLDGEGWLETIAARTVAERPRSGEPASSGGMVRLFREARDVRRRRLMAWRNAAMGRIAEAPHAGDHLHHEDQDEDGTGE